MLLRDRHECYWVIAMRGNTQEMDEKQQLIAGNAMLRQMAKIADPDDKMEGYRKVANYIEAGEYLSNHKLFNAGMNALSDKALRLENLTQPALLEG